MVMKQSMNSGTLDNISCIFICFNNFKKVMQAKFNNFVSKEKDLNLNVNNSQAFNVKNEYNEHNSGVDLHNSSSSNFDEIRKKLTYYKEASIKLKINEFVHFSEYENREYEKKPKTSSEALKMGRLDFINDNNDIEYKPVITNTDTNPSINMEDKQLYKIVSKKIKTPVVNVGKNYESNLPSFKISQKINKFPKDINMRKLSPINKMGLILNGYNYTNNNNNNNMNSTSKNANRFLPSITKNIGSTTHYNEKKNNNNNNQGSFKFNKPMQLNFDYNK